MRGSREEALVALIDALPDPDRRHALAVRGRYTPGLSPPEVWAALFRLFAADPVGLLLSLAQDPGALGRAHAALTAGARYPGRAEALLGVARRLGLPLPASEYALPEEGIDQLLARVGVARGARVPVRGPRGHKGRVGDGVERLLLGGKVLGKRRDHPAAELKSVPVRGDRVIERVKLGVVSARSNPLEKCDRVLFVFVEQRGRDHFVRGHALHDFTPESFRAMWTSGELVETAAGSPRFPARGLYLTPHFFRRRGLWPR